MMFYKKVCNYWARRRPAIQEQAKHDAECNLIFSLRTLLAWKFGYIPYVETKMKSRTFQLFYRENICGSGPKT